MTPTAKILIPTIEKEFKKLRESFPHDSYYAIQILIRRLDVMTLFYWKSKHQSEEQVNETREFFNFGWPPLLKLFLADIGFNKPHRFIQTSEKDYAWADSVIVHAGRLAFCKQLLDYEKADILEFTNPRENEFEIKYKDDQTGIEYFERIN